MIKKCKEKLLPYHYKQKYTLYALYVLNVYLHRRAVVPADFSFCVQCASSRSATSPAGISLLHVVRFLPERNFTSGHFPFSGSAHLSERQLHQQAFPLFAVSFLPERNLTSRLLPFVHSFHPLKGQLHQQTFPFYA